MTDDLPKFIGEKVQAIFAASKAGELTPEKEALFISILKTEHLMLCAAVVAAVEQNDLEGLYRVATAMPTLGLNPLFKERFDVIAAERKANADKLANLNKPAPPKKSAGPSPWGL